MAKIVLIDPINDPRWDAFVESHPLGWICHLSGWNYVLQRSFKHMRGHYLALVDENKDLIRAAMPLYEVRSWVTGNRLVSIPFATLCDPLISSSEEFEILFESALNLSKKLGLSSIELRTLRSSPLIQDDRLCSTHLYKHHYLLLESEPELLKKNFHRTCVRQKISRALKSNLTLRIADHNVDLLDFYQLHLVTRKRLGLPPQPHVFFRSLWDAFFASNRVSLLFAQKDNKAIAAIVLFKFKGRVSIEISVSDHSYSNVSPTHFLFWEAIKLAYSNGYRILDFGRTTPNRLGMMDFKKRWGTKMVDLPHFYYPKQAGRKLAKSESSMRYKLTRTICRNAPTFVSRRIGEFCYRHLG